MAASGVLTISGNISGTPTGAINLGPLTITSGNAIGEVLVQTLSVGPTTITIPTGTTAIILQGANAQTPAPNPTFSGKLTVGGVGDTVRIPIAASVPTVLAFDAGNPAPASLVINTTVATSVTLWIL